MQPDWHTQALAKLTGDPLDVLVIGGGIVGSGIARDAAMRGLSTGLIEQYDFAQGTSSRSSRLLHGGLRYLAQGRIGLVRESSVEKRIVQQIAPHLTSPLPFVFPTYQNNRQWKLWQLKLGVKLYDLLCKGRNFGASQSLSVKQTLEHVPGLSTDGLNGAVRYYDALTNDARLVIDTLRSAQAHGAALASHVKLLQASRENDLWHCQVFDTASQKTHVIRSKWVVSAAGAWSPGLPNSKTHLRLTKGAHLVADHSRVPVSEALVMTQGKRILFALPWGGRTILGTTDTDYDKVIEDVHCEPQDREYILDIANTFFPDAKLTPQDVLSTWAGLRPLIASKSGSPSEASRSHQIHQTREHWLEVAGGKLTTYRLMAQETVQRIVQKLPGRFHHCPTASQPLLDPSQTAFSSVIPPAVTKEAVEHYCQNEWALSLEDVMVRRTSWHHYLDDPAGQAVQIVQWIGDTLGWSPEKQAHELASYQAMCTQKR